MIWAADENQSFRLAPHGCTVDRLLFHSRRPKSVVLHDPPTDEWRLARDRRELFRDGSPELSVSSRED
jgi:hypothetical protein